jgi:NitT/TauT family transport system ATP-binding protein
MQRVFAENENLAELRALIRFNGVGHAYQHSGHVVPVLDDVNFDVAPGQCLAIIGPSGSGKSTLLGMMTGRISPTNGSVTIETESGRSPRCSMVFQEPTLMPWLTAAENVRLPLELEGRDSSGAQADELLKRVGLADFGAFKPAQLSGGMQSRVALARALVTNPELLLLDEPFSNLDEATSEDMLIDLTTLAEASGASVVLISHSLAQAAYMADRVLVMSARPGRVYADLTFDAPRPRRREFLDDATFHAFVQQLRVALREAVHGAAA